MGHLASLHSASIVAGPMKRATLRERLRYRFDNTMSRGLGGLIGWLGLISVTLVTLVSLVV